MDLGQDKPTSYFPKEYEMNKGHVILLKTVTSVSLSILTQLFCSFSYVHVSLGNLEKNKPQNIRKSKKRINGGAGFGSFCEIQMINFNSFLFFLKLKFVFDRNQFERL